MADCADKLHWFSSFLSQLWSSDTLLAQAVSRDTHPPVHRKLVRSPLQNLELMQRSIPWTRPLGPIRSSPSAAARQQPLRCETVCIGVTGSVLRVSGTFNHFGCQHPVLHVVYTYHVTRVDGPGRLPREGAGPLPAGGQKHPVIRPKPFCFINFKRCDGGTNAITFIL